MTAMHTLNVARLRRGAEVLIGLFSCSFLRMPKHLRGLFRRGESKSAVYGGDEDDYGNKTMAAVDPPRLRYLRCRRERKVTNLLR